MIERLGADPAMSAQMVAQVAARAGVLAAAVHAGAQG